MGVLIFTCSTAATTPPLLRLPSSSQSIIPSISNSGACSLYRKPGGLRAQILNGQKTCLPLLLKEKSRLMCKASEEGAGAGAGPESPPPSSETGEKAVPVEKKPSPEEKLQLKLEQKVRMKLAKKLRLKRKRLVRKRHLRKKGRWPPSKMKKHQNV